MSGSWIMPWRELASEDYRACEFNLLFSYPLSVGEDFSSPNLDLFFPTGSMDGALLPVTFNITDDGAFEKDHSFNVSIVEVEDNVEIAPPSTAIVTILDDEGYTGLSIAGPH